MKVSTILGLNARTQLFSYRYNTLRGRKVCDSKLQTATVLKKSGIAHPQIHNKFRRPEDTLAFDFSSLPSSFALKPSRGLGGEGIVVIKRRANDGAGWITTQKTRVDAEDLKLHILDILEGAYSMGNTPDVAFIQEFVGRHKAFRKYAYRGTPDIRIIVFNKVPVMAMLRLPTKDSGGRANLHQGAIAVGIDMATGITTKAVWYGKQISLKPGSKRKLRGIKIPEWTKILEMAVEASLASNMGYLGVDIVLHPQKGPMVLELNAQPGLQIQLANAAGLRRRLDRVEDLQIRDSKHGVNIAKAIFVERFTDRVKAEEGIKTVSIWENVKVVSSQGKKHELTAKIDTGAWRTSLDKDLAKDLGLLEPKNILWTRKVRTSLGKEERSVINLTLYIAGKRVATAASVSKRKTLRTPIIIGRRDLEGFLVSPTFQDKGITWVPPMWTAKG